MMTLSLSRRSAVQPLPLSSVTTHDPQHGYLIHPHLDVAAAHVVKMGGGLTVRTEPHPKAGQRIDGDGSPARWEHSREPGTYPATRTVVEHTGPARILSTPEGLTVAAERAALEQARAALPR